MTNINIDKARNNFQKIVSSCIKYNEVVKISTSNGCVVLLSEKYYNSLVESLRLANIYKDINKATKTPTSKFVKDAPWH